MNLLSHDFEFIYQASKETFQSLDNTKIFITGGTGFFGKWILGSLNYANLMHGANTQAFVLTRNIDFFRKSSPELTSPLIHFIEGDIRNFSLNPQHFDYLIHGANPPAHSDQNELLSTLKAGTDHFLSFAKNTQAKKLLLLSSGAIYGKQDPSVPNQSENSSVDLNKMSGHTYIDGKRYSEKVCLEFSKISNIPVSIARCYAFVGPHLPLDRSYAIGNFIGDCIYNRDIQIQGDGSSLRSYMYAADLVIWLLKILVSGRNCSTYNVGSEELYSIKEIAEKVKQIWMESTFDNFRLREPKIHILNQSGVKKSIYAPSTKLAKSELRLSTHFSLDDAIRKTLTFYINIT